MCMTYALEVLDPVCLNMSLIFGLVFYSEYHIRSLGHWLGATSSNSRLYNESAVESVETTKVIYSILMPISNCLVLILDLV